MNGVELNKLAEHKRKLDINKGNLQKHGVCNFTRKTQQTHRHKKGEKELMLAKASSAVTRFVDIFSFVLNIGHVEGGSAFMYETNFS